jgi:hypothetical protein
LHQTEVDLVLQHGLKLHPTPASDQGHAEMGMDNQDPELNSKFCQRM